MKHARSMVMVLVMLALPLAALAQMADEVEVREVTEKYDLGLAKRPTFSFFDPSRFDFAHSYSLSYFSGSGYSGTMGLYNGTMRYYIADPLTLTLNLGILHDPGSLFGHTSFSDNSMFLPSGWLDWRPSENFRMTLGFETVPAYFYRGSYYYPGRYFDWHR